MLNRQQRLYRNYKRHGFKSVDKARVDRFRDECKIAVQNAKISYLEKMGSKLADAEKCQKYYWKIINRVINRSRAPKTPRFLTVVYS